MGGVNAGELIVLGRELTKIGTAALRGARLPGGAVPSGIAMVGADVLAHSPTSAGEIADRTGLRRGYVSESVAKLRDQGVVETAPDPRDSRRTLVRLTAAHPERVTAAASEPVEAALRDALGPGTDRETAIALLAALVEVAERLRPADEAGGAGPRADAARAEPAPADRTRVDITPAGHTRVDITRVTPLARRQGEGGPGRGGPLR